MAIKPIVTSSDSPIVSVMNASDGTNIMMHKGIPITNARINAFL